MRFALILRDLMDKHGVSKYRLATDLGVSKATISNYLNDTTEPQTTIRSTILNYFEALENGKNPVEGKSLRKRINDYYKAEENDEINSIAFTDKITSKLSEVEQNTYTVSLLPISAMAGKLNDFVTSIKEIDCEKIVSPIQGIDFALTVYGDSMQPKYPSGSKIFVKRIYETDFIDWGKVYVIDTTNGTLVKIINPSENEGYIKCESINPSYLPVEVPLRSVFGIYKVMMCMSMESN